MTIKSEKCPNRPKYGEIRRNMVEIRPLLALGYLVWEFRLVAFPDS